MIIRIHIQNSESKDHTVFKRIIFKYVQQRTKKQTFLKTKDKHKDKEKDTFEDEDKHKEKETDTFENKDKHKDKKCRKVVSRWRLGLINRS